LGDLFEGKITEIKILKLYSENYLLNFSYDLLKYPTKLIAQNKKGGQIAALNYWKL
jgi:hypothetical protein